MTKFTADYVALAPVWGVIELDTDFDGKSQFLYEAENFVRDTYDGASEIDIRNVREV